MHVIKGFKERAREQTEQFSCPHKENKNEMKKNNGIGYQPSAVWELVIHKQINER